MGVCYFYGNRSKEQWFYVDPAGIGLKASSIGTGLGGRALGLLLLDDHPDYSMWENHPLLGSWSGDSIYVSGDDYAPDFVAIQSEWTDISAEVLDLMSIADPASFFDVGERWLATYVEHAMSDEIRQRLLRHARQLRHTSGDPTYDRVIELLRPPAGGNGSPKC